MRFRVENISKKYKSIIDVKLLLYTTTFLNKQINKCQQKVVTVQLCLLEQSEKTQVFLEIKYDFFQ